MKESRRSAPTRTASRRVRAASPSTSRARPVPPTSTQATTSRIVDKMQRLALRRPKMLQLLEILLDGMLKDSRRDDDHALDD
jgi:hypothetical protein